MARLVTVHKAMPTGSAEPLEGVRIDITQQQPEHSLATYVEDAQRLYRDDAAAIHAALKALPGGTSDQLFSLMAADRASLFRVALPTGGGDE